MWGVCVCVCVCVVCVLPPVAEKPYFIEEIAKIYEAQVISDNL